MLKKYQELGKTLSKDEMKAVKGGIVWPYLRVFGCTNGGGFNEGCTDWSTFGVNCCASRYGSSSTPIWHEPYIPCSAQACGEI